MKRTCIAAVLLALLLTALPLASCSETPENNPAGQSADPAGQNAGQTEVAAPAETEEDVNSRLAEKDNLPSSKEDAEMMDICVDARVFDMGYVYDNWKGVSFCFEELLRNPRHQDITSYYEKKKKVAEKYYAKVVELFTNEG